MHNPSRFVLVVAVALLLLAGVAAFLPQSLVASQLTATDDLVTAAAPVGLAIAEGKDAPFPTSTALSNVYMARLGADGSQMTLVRPLVKSVGTPKVPAGGGNDLAQAVVSTVTSVSGSGLWRAEIVDSGTTRVLVAAPYNAIRDTDRPIGVVLLIVRLVVLAFAALSGWWLVRLALRPIREVTRVANAISSGDRSRRLPAGPPSTAAGRLAIAFNEMLDEEHASEDRLRRFVADASHELRTPVSAIGGFADLYRQGAIEPDRLDEVMRRIGQESARMRDLVEDMLLLARLDEGRPVSHTRIDLVGLAEDAVFDAASNYPSRTMLVDGGGVWVEANESQLRQVFANLIGNALSYTAGAIRITIREVDKSAVITIGDDGPGLDPEAVALVFDRFWRGEASRTRAGSGLGLAIVKGIVEAHGGRISLQSDPAAGTMVTITLLAGGQELVPAGNRQEEGRNPITRPA